ncbi:MAG: class I SAM-dependent methyltransferase [Pseudomonadota bacterium]
MRQNITLPGKPRSRLGALARGVRLLYHPRSFLRTTGQLRSFQENQAVDVDGAPLAWVNYAMLHLLNQRLNGQMRVFEYGCGASTLYFAARVGQVISVEHNAEWASAVATEFARLGNVTLTQQTDQEQYIQHIREHAPFDVVLIDGLSREDCLPVALQCLTDKGVVLLDDSQRPQYQAPMTHATELGFKRLDLRGPKPVSLFEAQTTLLYRAENCLGI